MTAFNNIRRPGVSGLHAMTNISCEAVTPLLLYKLPGLYACDLLQWTINLAIHENCDATNPALGVFKCLNDCFLSELKHRMEMESSYYSSCFYKKWRCVISKAQNTCTELYGKALPNIHITWMLCSTCLYMLKIPLKLLFPSILVTCHHRYSINTEQFNWNSNSCLTTPQKAPEMTSKQSPRANVQTGGQGLCNLESSLPACTDEVFRLWKQSFDVSAPPEEFMKTFTSINVLN